MSKKNRLPELIIFAGPNGSGKTTITRMARTIGVYINACLLYTSSALDEILTRYMYYERAKQGIKQTTTEALRKFYERDGYKLLKLSLIHI